MPERHPIGASTAAGNRHANDDFASGYALTGVVFKLKGQHVGRAGQLHELHVQPGTIGVANQSDGKLVET